ncbi:MAG: hypothetical protein ACJATT_001347 [Myxococcota bacterium]|jgi:hypothetical protein
MSDPSDAPFTPGAGILSESADRLMSRAPKPLSAHAALEAARKAEQQRHAQAEQDVTLPPPETDDTDAVVDVLRSLVADVVVLKRTYVDRRDVFTAVWQAHQARARIERDLPIAIAAAVLIAAAKRVPKGHLVAVEVALGTERRATWVDTSTGTVLATASPPAIYLIG